MPFEVRQARTSEASIVEAILVETAQWVDALGEVMWDDGELAPEQIADVIAFMKSLTASSALVGTGSAASLPLKIVMKRGTTNLSRKTVVPIAIVPMMPG